MNGSTDNLKPEALNILPEVMSVCLESLEEIKKAYMEAHTLRNRVIELEKIASAPAEKPAAKINESLVDQTVRNLVASSFLDISHMDKLAAEIKVNPSIALNLVQRFIEISTPPFSEGHGVAKNASTEHTLDDPDGWAKVIKEGA